MKIKILLKNKKKKKKKKLNLWLVHMNLLKKAVKWNK